MPDLIIVWKTISGSKERKYKLFPRHGEELPNKAADPSAHAEMAACLSRKHFPTLAKVRSKLATEIERHHRMRRRRRVLSLSMRVAGARGPDETRRTARLQ
jgi:hypothetical protein